MELWAHNTGPCSVLSNGVTGLAAHMNYRHAASNLERSAQTEAMHTNEARTGREMRPGLSKPGCPDEEVTWSPTPYHILRCLPRFPSHCLALLLLSPHAEGSEWHKFPLLVYTVPFLHNRQALNHLGCRLLTT